uniref:Uncharacterized protein n=1 Tax=Parascaris equorum TaxID=6256 RepID=A0A914R173_PAREQ
LPSRHNNYFSSLAFFCVLQPKRKRKTKIYLPSALKRSPRKTIELLRLITASLVIKSPFGLNCGRYAAIVYSVYTPTVLGSNQNVFFNLAVITSYVCGRSVIRVAVVGHRDSYYPYVPIF